MRFFYTKVCKKILLSGTSVADAPEPGRRGRGKNLARFLSGIRYTSYPRKKFKHRNTF